MSGEDDDITVVLSEEAKRAFVRDYEEHVRQMFAQAAPLARSLVRNRGGGASDTTSTRDRILENAAQAFERDVLFDKFGVVSSWTENGRKIARNLRALKSQ